MSLMRGNSRFNLFPIRNDENGGAVTTTAEMLCRRMILRAFRKAKGVQSTSGSGQRMRRLSRAGQLRQEELPRLSGEPLPGGVAGPAEGRENHLHNFCLNSK